MPPGLGHLTLFRWNVADAPSVVPARFSSTQGECMNEQVMGMRQQQAGQSVIEELLRQQVGAPERTWFGRLIGVSPLGPNSVSWYRGAVGELAVGRILATLPDEWVAFHALPIGKKGADIDHLVIGPGGIVTINTKNHSGKSVWVGGQTLMVSGQKVPHIRNADFEATRVTTLLRERMPLLPAAQPVLAILDPKTLNVKAKPEHVTVLSAARLRRWLVKRPVVLSPDQLAELTAIINERSTWPPAVLPPVENAPALFAGLDAEVRAAHGRRRLVSVLGTATLVVGGWFASQGILHAYISAVTGG